MLLEIKCDKFIKYGEPRPPIAFSAGLNTVLGSETGSNSIGKSTFLMIVDFAFGGDDYVLKSTDVQTQVGPHTIQFSFEFNGKRYYFSRETINHTIVHRCDAKYNPIAEMSRDEFRAFLFEQYGVKLPLITFRDIVGRYFRIYGRDNLDEKHPLHAAQGEAPKKAITALMKLFNRYASIHDLEVATERSKGEMDAYKKAQEFHFIPRIGKRQLADNEKRIEALQVELTKIQISSGNELMGLDSQQAEVLADLRRKLTSVKRQKSRLMSQLTSIENDLSADRPDELVSSDNQQYRRLLDYFPEANLKKIEEIEQFHNQLVNVLNSEYEDARHRYTNLISMVDNEIKVLEQEVTASGLTPKVSRALLEDYAAKKGLIKAIEKDNETYTKLDELKNAAKNLEARLVALQEEQIGFLQNTINLTMNEINDVVYQGEKKAPVLTIKKPNSYTFLTPDDTGTGTSYKGLVVFDLSVLRLTALPALVHDSVILKQIADEPLERIIELYSASTKQVFISLDKKGSYSGKTQKLLDATTVIHLSDNGNELFGRSWNVKE